MKKQKSVLILILALAAALLLCSCGSSYKSGDSFDPELNSADYGWDDDYVLQENSEASSWEPSESIDAPAGDYSAREPQESARKIIKNGSMSVETLEYDKFIAELESSVVKCGGYIESSNEYGYNSSSRRANFTVRIPSGKYDEFITTVGRLATVVSSEHSIDDVTLQYVDIEARLSALTAERDSFMSLMEKAETIDEILQIQSYLTDVNYQIESYTSQLNTLKDLVSYSTVNISVNEVQRVTDPEPKTVGERISQNLSRNMYDIGVGFTNLFVAAVSSLPYLLILAAVLLIILAIVLTAVKLSNRKQNKLKKKTDNPKDGEDK